MVLGKCRKYIRKNWYNTDYFVPSSNFWKGGLLKGGEIDVARAHMFRGVTRGTPWVS